MEDNPEAEGDAGGIQSAENDTPSLGSGCSIHLVKLVSKMEERPCPLYS
jgi:hypothetical protein